MGKLFKWILICFGGLVLLGVLIDSAKTPEQRAADQLELQKTRDAEAAQSRQRAQNEMASLPTIQASQLANAYAENTVAADQQFKSKKFKITGTVNSINTDLFGNPYLTLKGGVNQFMEPQFKFDESAERQLATLRKGMSVTIVCVGSGDVAKIPMSKDCVLP